VPDFLQTKLLEDAILDCLKLNPEGLLPKDMNAWIASHLNIEAQLLQLKTSNNEKNLFAYRMAWARVHLKNRGSIERTTSRKWILAKE
jgi:hypothetical protein